MVATYTASGAAFLADKSRLWSPGQFTSLWSDLNFDLHPDGKRFAVLKALDSEERFKVNKVNFVFNFFDELIRKVPVHK